MKGIAGVTGAGEASVNELAAPFSMSLPAVSKHIKVLHKAGLISKGRDAQFPPCRIDGARLKEAVEWISQYKQFWEQRLDRLDAYLSTLQSTSTAGKKVKPTYQPNSKFDLSFTRDVDVPRALVWRAWTEPERLKPWFCPLPWKTIDCEIDLRPGGIFRTTMQSPEGQKFPNAGCYLEVKPNEKLVWTNALLPGYRPSFVTATSGSEGANFIFTAMIELADNGQGTRYTATVIHADEDGCKKHAAMGFEDGWGTALDQLVAMIKKGM